MAFSGNMGASAAMTPVARIENDRGEAADSYDADSKVVFARATGSKYTPARVDTLVVRMGLDEATPPLAETQTGAPSAALSDAGAFVTSAPGADQHGLPANFGPGRGKWGAGDASRIRVHIDPVYDAPAAGETTDPTDAVGHLTDVSVTIAFGDILILVRNMNKTELFAAQIVIEYTHSIQG